MSEQGASRESDAAGPEAESGPVTVFGGSGFLGRQVVQQLGAAGLPVRVAARRPGKLDQPQGEAVKTDVRDEAAVAAAVRGARAAVNAVSLYAEKGDLNFQAIHVQAAERIARCAREAGLRHLVHVSGIGVDLRSSSKFVRARAEGEERVLAAFPRATILRPSVMVDCDGGFLKALKDLTALPVAPLFGGGGTRLQPAWVQDVARGIVRIVTSAETPGPILELGGGAVYTYREAVRLVADRLGRRPLLLPVPFAAWQVLVGTMAVLPNPPLTRDQLILMQSDNIVGPQAVGFAALGIEPRSLQAVVTDCYPQA
ncbi:complex I NDUFA9 subunit family protein [Gilvimarinus sp. F26214L]|uniref:complex I NDUFA9 subunit family protein n=1 Tax=Gilvimarinus sp. DZF01 TaxID=3461371 RepID=UPI0040455A0E